MNWSQVNRVRALRQRRWAAIFMVTCNAVAWALGGYVAFTVVTAINLGVWIVALDTTRDELKQLEGRSDRSDWPRLN